SLIADSATTNISSIEHNHKFDPDPDGCETCSLACSMFFDAALANFPHLAIHFEIALSVCGIMALPKPFKPVAVFFEGPSGPGKTTISNVLLGGTDKIVGSRLYRCDDLTAAAFVSHAANVTKKDLEKVDLLPRITDKVLVTPELGPFFRGKRDEIENRWAILARVLDGRGLVTDSGVHGRRGYEGDYPFVWLGATTYLPDAAFEAMA